MPRRLPAAAGPLEDAAGSDGFTESVWQARSLRGDLALVGLEGRGLAPVHPQVFLGTRF
ncbi:hypothetical protein Pla86_53000 (plasmid) [Planctomycetes bacterium Pla86]|nr:hypothetical protein Pla86_53000 [Planctomycetes bacterium Pla86]